MGTSELRSEMPLTGTKNEIDRPKFHEAGRSSLLPVSA